MHAFPFLIVFWVLLAFIPQSDAGESSEQDETREPAGHSLHAEVFNEGPRQRAYLMGGTGDVSLKITTNSCEAQQFFNQGLGQLHGFWHFEAERSFRQVAALDPECAMAYWGMAMANQANPKRGRGFIAEAVKRKTGVSSYEAAFIDALMRYLAPLRDGKPQPAKERGTQYVRALEDIVHEYPALVEAKALLVLQIWENTNHGIAITSREAVAALLREVLAAHPNHPAHHYVIHLWDGNKPAQALPSAALCGQSAPGIAHMWHMPGHTYSRLHRYADAVWHQEAAARVDHAYMVRDRIMPDQIHNYAHNNDWLVENLVFVGRIHDAVDVAANLAELPLHPRYNAPGRGGSNTLGRRRLLMMLPQFELWDDLLRLADTACLAPLDDKEDAVRLHRALGAAHIAKGQHGDAKAHISALQRLEDKLKADHPQPDAAAGTGGIPGRETTSAGQPRRPPQRRVRLDAISRAIHDLQGRWALEGNDLPDALSHFAKVNDLPKEFLSQVEARAGNFAKAERLALEAVKAGPDRVLPLANCVEILHRCGKIDEASQEFRKLCSISSFIDHGVPIFDRLDELAPKLGLPREWRQTYRPADDVGRRPDLASLGPLRWSPTAAPGWTLPDVDGNSASLIDYRGRPVLLIFYLGFRCLHCVEQLEAFAPMHAEFASAGIEMVAISTDDVEALSASLKAREATGGPLPLKLLSDTHLDAFKGYRAFDDFEGHPLHGIFLVDGAGLVRWQDISYEPFTNANFLFQEAKRLMGLPYPKSPRGERADCASICTFYPE